MAPANPSSTKLAKATVRTAGAATDEQLVSAVEDRLEQAKGHVASPLGQRCEAVRALLAQVEETPEFDAEPDVLDAGLIASTQRIEHYEVARYPTVRAYARLLRREGDPTLLQETPEEEGRAGRRLSNSAEKTVDARELSQ